MVEEDDRNQYAKAYCPDQRRFPVVHGSFLRHPEDFVGRTAISRGNEKREKKKKKTNKPHNRTVRNVAARTTVDNINGSCVAAAAAACTGG